MAQGFDVLVCDQVGETRTGEATASADSLTPQLEVVCEALPGQVCLQRGRVVSPDQGSGTRSRAGGGTFAVEHQGIYAALGEVEGDARAHHPSPDHDYICRVHSVLEGEGLCWP
jgi:hypothetical protein